MLGWETTADGGVRGPHGARHLRGGSARDLRWRVGAASSCRGWRRSPCRSARCSPGSRRGTRQPFAVERFPVFILDVESGSWYGFPAYGGHGVKVGWYHHFREPIGSGRSGPIDDRRTTRRSLRGFVERYLPAAGRTDRDAQGLHVHELAGRALHHRPPAGVAAGHDRGRLLRPRLQVLQRGRRDLADLALDGSTSHDIGLFRPRPLCGWLTRAAGERRNSTVSGPSAWWCPPIPSLWKGMWTTWWMNPLPGGVEALYHGPPVPHHSRQRNRATAPGLIDCPIPSEARRICPSGPARPACARPPRRPGARSLRPTWPSSFASATTVAPSAGPSSTTKCARLPHAASSTAGAMTSSPRTGITFALPEMPRLAAWVRPGPAGRSPPPSGLLGPRPGLVGRRSAGPSAPGRRSSLGRFGMPSQRSARHRGVFHIGAPGHRRMSTFGPAGTLGTDCRLVRVAAGHLALDHPLHDEVLLDPPAQLVRLRRVEVDVLLELE